MPAAISPVLATLGLLLVAAAPRAQCALQGLPGGGVPGVNGAVHAMTVWDPDGPGPLPEQIVCGGDFSLAGGTAAGRLAVYDPSTNGWTALPGSAFNATVEDVVVMPNNELVVVGSFDYVGATPAAYVARWNGVTWSQLGSGLPWTAHAACVLSNGDLLVGGAYGVARWDGVTWTQLSGANVGVVSDVVEMPNGDLVASWSVVPPPPAFSYAVVARWTGTSWVAFGSADSIQALAVQPNGHLIAVGDNFGAGVQSWDGVAWTTVGGSTGGLYSVLAASNGDLIVGGTFPSLGGVGAARLARWNGTTWSGYGSGIGDGAVTALVLAANGDLYTGGSFTVAGGIAANQVARWSGTWAALAGGTDGDVFALALLPGGDLVAGGEFHVIEGVPANGIARRSGGSWSSLGTGVAGPFVGVVQAIAALANGDVVAGGDFASAGGVPAAFVARWNGSTWAPMGAGLPHPVWSLAVLPSGDVLAVTNSSLGGPRQVHRWNGAAWSPIGTASGLVTAVAAMDNGDAIATGVFTSIDGVAANRIARWDGSSWSALGSGLNDTGWTLLPEANGAFVVGGAFTQAGGQSVARVARWNGAGWSPLGNSLWDGSVRSLVAMPDGDLVAGGTFSYLGNTARWDGTTWTAVPGGTDNQVKAIAVLPTGELAIGGMFQSVAGQVSYRFGRFQTPCAAVAAPYASGCPGSGGSNTLVALTPPWVDATFRARGTGLPATALVVAATSFTSIPQGALPLATVLPLGVPGCDLLVAPDILQLAATVTGTVDVSMFLPNTPPLVGLAFYHQWIPIELDPQGNFVAITATNSLQLTAGAF